MILEIAPKSNKKRPKYAGPIYFHADVYLRDDFRNRPKIQQKRPKYAGPIYFHADVYLRDDSRNRPKIQQKKAQIRRPDLFTCGCIQRHFLCQFLLISLLRSGGSLRLPRSLRARTNKLVSSNWFVLTNCLNYEISKYYNFFFSISSNN